MSPFCLQGIWPVGFNTCNTLLVFSPTNAPALVDDLFTSLISEGYEEHDRVGEPSLEMLRECNLSQFIITIIQVRIKMFSSVMYIFNVYI